MKKNLLKQEFKKGLSNWTKTLPPILALTGLKQPRIMDVGGAAGEILMALSTLGFGDNYLVDPHWKLHVKHYLPKTKQTVKYYKQKGIKILQVSGYDEKVPYDAVDLIIKTYNPFVDWSYILKNTSASWIITDDQWLPEDYEKKLEIRATFNNSAGYKTGEVSHDRCVYHLCRIKKK